MIGTTVYRINGGVVSIKIRMRPNDNSLRAIPISRLFMHPVKPSKDSTLCDMFSLEPPALVGRDVLFE